MVLGSSVPVAATGRPSDMRLTSMTLVLCVCVWLSAGDVSHVLKSKARLAGRLAGKLRKRGVLSSVPPFKLGHDIPLVTHSVVKPLVVTYPPTASVTAVKVPLAHPLLDRYPVGVGHKVPVPHPHYGLKFPHHTKAVLPDRHYHHHHHHVAPRPPVPVVASPIPVPTAAIAHPLPAPHSAVAVPSTVVPHPPLPVHFSDVHLRQFLPAAPLLPAPPVAAPAPLAPQIPYVLRPGGSIQTSLFATYPRYPFGGFQPPVFPLSSTAFTQIVPHAPQYLLPQGDPQEGVVVGQPAGPAILHAHGEPATPGVHLEPAQPAFHLHPEQPDIHLYPAQPGVQLHSAQPEFQLQSGVHAEGQPDVHLQPAQPTYNLQPVQPEYLGGTPGHTDVHLQSAQPGYHFQAGQTDLHLQPGQPAFPFYPGQQDLNFQPGQPEFHLQPGQGDVHLQPQPDYHFQPGYAQGEEHAHTGQPDHHHHLLPQPEYRPTQPTVDSQGWAPVPAQPSDVGQHDPQYPADYHHHFAQDQGTQVYEQHPGDQLQHHIHQQLDQAQAQGGQEYHYPQPAAEYGPPAEGRSTDDDGDSAPHQLYRDHIPLGLQPPIDRPLEQFSN